MPISKPARMWRLADARFGRYQDSLFALLLAAVAVSAALLLASLLALIWATLVWRGDLESPGILLEAGLRPSAPSPAAAYKGADEGVAAGDGNGAPGAPRVPRVDWTKRVLRRRAASALCLDGNYRDAIELLRPGDPGRKELLAVSEDQHGDVLRALAEILPVEGRRATDFWESLPERATTPRRPPESTLLAPPKVRDTGAATATLRLLRRYGEILPQALLYRFVVNLHCRLRDRTGASDAHLRLLLESCLPPGSVARKLYVEGESPRPYPYRQDLDP